MVQATVKTSEPSAEQLAFRFVSGDRALDFLATLADRHRGGLERLRQPGDLDKWLRAAGLPTSSRATPQHLENAWELREAVNRLARASLRGQAADSNDIAELNQWTTRLPLAPQLDSEFRRHWRSPEPVAGALALIAREAVELLSGPERELIRECAAAPACSLLYLDRSRGRRRRWCEMERCGARAKMADYRHRQGARNDT